MAALTPIGFAALLVCLAACVDPKPTVPMPEVRSNLRPALVASVPPEAGPSDARTLTLAAGRLYIADGTGLYIVDASNPTAPTVLGALRGAAIDRVAVRDGTAFAIAAGAKKLRVIDVSSPASPRLASEVDSPSLIFSGIDARPGLVWHATGGVPPSRLFYGPTVDARASCSAPDRERGAMDVWLRGDRAIVSIHYDDFAGDGIDGNGAFGWLLFAIEGKSACPRVVLTDKIFADTHAANRSAFERSANSDLQADYDPASGRLYLTGEQRLRILDVDGSGRASELGRIDLPDALDVAVDTTFAGGHVAGLANGAFLVVDARNPRDPRFGGALDTPGTARAVVAAGDGAHFFVGDSEGGVAVVRVTESGP